MNLYQQNNYRKTVHNWPVVSNAPFQPSPKRAGLGTRFFQLIGLLFWIVVAIVAIGRCSANGQTILPPDAFPLSTPPQGWSLPQSRGQSPDTLRCIQRGADWICSDKRSETTCRMQGFEWICDRRAR